ncbi:MAG: type transport system ATP-binding protein [Acidimicrobiaceae bacterium]|nr:type transport system ATP-binding protein [Acidimicrobiaceae bacterium]MDQ1445868.1 type transport system ATP-binding protein [Acidimicrobiaceae bacterium]
MTATIEVDALTKWFGDLVALSDVSFSVEPGVTAMLGPNGAGKSTLLRVLCGLTAPSRGTVRVLGRSPRGDISLYRRIGLVPQQESLFDGMTAYDFVTVSAELTGMAKGRVSGNKAAGALELVELDPADRRPIAAYSKGMRQRVKVAAALVHDPELVVLDEPLEGLDPRQRLRMIELFRRLGDEGRTVLVSSHVLDEVERFGSRVLVIVQGKLAAEGDFRAIRELMEDRPHRVRVRSDDARALAAGLMDAGAALGVRVAGENVVIDTDQVGALRRSLAVVARERGARLFEVVPLDDDLESVFRYLVERR